MSSNLLHLLLFSLATLASCGKSADLAVPVNAASIDTATAADSARPPQSGAGLQTGIAPQSGAVPEPLPELRQDFFSPTDRVVVLGNGLADRMQHDGWMESYLQAALAELPTEFKVSFRNHGYTGDRIDHRPRNKGFLSADEYLKLSQPSVIFAMFGYNESFDDDPATFKVAVIDWVKHTRGQNYSGLGAPRIVLFSPIAAQDLHDANLPNVAQINRRLGDYAAAIEVVAQQMNVRFVDLFTPSLHRFTTASSPLTINEVHLNASGHRAVGKLITEALFNRLPSISESDLQRIRRAVLDKNWHWFNRYRATDGNDVWGSRSSLAFVDGQKNREVLQHELVQLDLMTENRDQVVWAAAQGQMIAPDDSKVPPAILVKTNLDQPQKQGGVSKIGDGTYLGGEEAIGKMKLAEGLSANLFASEEMFPEFINPVQLGVDPRGRLWAAVWATYPKWEPLKEMGDRLLILPDDDGDGVADRAVTFAYVHNPTGFEFWNGGVIVASAPDLLFLKDTDGDDVADVRYRLLGGIDSADTHHTANNFVLGPDGFLYYQRGVFHVSNVETPWQVNQESTRAGMYRFNPRTFEFSFHAANSPNAHGISFDYWGYHFATDGTGGRPFQVVPDAEGKFKMRKLFNQTVRPVASSGILSSAHFPEKYQGNFLLCNTIAFLGLKQYTLAFNTETGEVNGTETEDFLVSSDPNFRPTDLEIGSDGAMYVADWCNAIVGHMQHNVRDPKRDHLHGRIYRITADGQPLSKHVAVHGLAIPDLLDVLKNPINGIRQRARAELSERDSAEVVAATKEWLAQFDSSNAKHAHHILEGLWVYQQHNVENRDLLDVLLKSPEPHARIAAQRVESMWDYARSKPVNLAESEEHGVEMEAPPEGVIVIQTVPEQMRYDIKSFSVKAGSKVRLWFANPDFMPHNLVIGLPGSIEEIGLAAEALGAQGFALGFIPDSESIIAHSKLLNFKESELIEFTAPANPGDYDFVCTFPGHWRLMNGTMKVTQ
jgi:azurin/glucose/arabinose dehydrogenase/lysophospholipase L1-like esterase